MNQFWQTKTLDQMTSEEWESLCDGCGQCCMIKLEDDDTGEVFRTNVSCQLLELESCRCLDYQNRFEKVPECVSVSLEKVKQFEWMPETCAYRLKYEGKPLFDWHPLITGSSKEMLSLGHSVSSYAISEEYIHPEQLQDHLVEKIS